MGAAYIVPVIDFNPNTAPAEVSNPSSTNFHCSTLCKSGKEQWRDGVTYGFRGYREVRGQKVQEKDSFPK